MVWATSCFAGMLKILKPGDNTADELRETFDLTEFHMLVLQNGSVPLDILEQVIEAYITRKKTGIQPHGAS